MAIDNAPRSNGAPQNRRNGRRRRRALGRDDDRRENLRLEYAHTLDAFHRQETMVYAGSAFLVALAAGTLAVIVQMDTSTKQSIVALVTLGVFGIAVRVVMLWAERQTSLNDFRFFRVCQIEKELDLLTQRGMRYLDEDRGADGSGSNDDPWRGVALSDNERSALDEFKAGRPPQRTSFHDLQDIFLRLIGRGESRYLQMRRRDSTRWLLLLGLGLWVVLSIVTVGDRALNGEKTSEPHVDVNLTLPAAVAPAPDLTPASIQPTAISSAVPPTPVP